MLALTDAKKLEGALKIVKVCANVQPDEKVLVITDTKTLKVGELVAMAALQITQNTILAVITPRRTNGDEPPPHLAGAMSDADVIFMPLKFSMTHAAATKEARKHGARVISMGDYNECMLEEGGIKADFLRIGKIVNRVADRLTQGRLAEITAVGGTRLRMDISGRRGYPETGIAHQPGSFAGPPNIEANVGPLEGATEGVIVVDGSIPFPSLGVITDPITLLVKGGKITEIKGGEQAKVLRHVLEEFQDSNIYHIAELGIGLNPESKISGSMLEDEGTYGTCHIGIGTNTSFGGTVLAKSHIDLILRESTIVIDGKPIQQNGKLVDEIEKE